MRANLKSRIKSLEQRNVERLLKANCTCYPWEGRFHNEQEAREAVLVPCPLHGTPRFKKIFLDMPPESPLARSDRHLCHCPPNRVRTAIEQGREPTREEIHLAHVEAEANWNAEHSKKEEVSADSPGVCATQSHSFSH
jgi:hypothetical protein